MSAQIKQRTEDAGNSSLTITGIEQHESHRQTRIPGDVLYQLLYSPTPTAEDVLREYYLLECD